MKRSGRIIACVFALLLAVTVVNLLYKPGWLLWWRRRRKDDGARWSVLASRVDPLTNTQCTLRGGFRCPDGERCDCQALCPEGDFLPFKVDAQEAIVVLDRQLEAGTYCLPREGSGAQACDRRHQIAVYSLSGWTCVDRHQGVFRNGRPVACYHPMAAEPDANVLVDRRTGVRARWESGEFLDYNETMPDGSRRFVCQCGSHDVWGNRMVRTLPFVCSVDYCLEDLTRAGQTLGWNGKACECGVYPHETPGDRTSPCRVETTRIEKDMLHLRIECTTQRSVEKKAWYCPPNVTTGVMVAQERVHVGHTPQDFVKRHYGALEPLP